jgi:large repetitive protein
MAKILSVRYTLVSGTLPNGLSINAETGVLSGTPGFDSLNQGPVWQSPAAGSLGSYNENDTISTITFSTNSDHTPVVFSLATSNDKLPWGLILNPSSGTITGTVAPLKLRVKEEGVTFDGPSWNTNFGKLAGYDEDAVASISLSATPIGSRTISRFTLVEGALPWGLKLNPATGVISGSVGRLKNPGVYVDVPKLPVPVFSTSSTVGTFLEYDSVNTTIAATPDSGRSMAKYIIREGFLPWGLKLNNTTGAITGTVADLVKRNEAAYYDSTNDPVFNNTVVINGSNTTVTDNGSIGSYPKGTSVSATFSATAASGRAIRNFWTIGDLPWGLKMNQTTGVVSGTILNNARVASKTYTFKVYTSDKNASNFLVNSSSRTFTITVQ